MYKFLSWTAVILWMALIIYLSHQPAETSSELSGGVTEVIAQTVEKMAPNMELDIREFHHEVRKKAHFFIYLVLGFLVINALRASNHRGLRSIGIAQVICMLYAISDEIHQLFVPGRSAEFMDVFIDSIGAAVGIVGYIAISRIIEIYKSNKKSVSKRRMHTDRK